MAAVSSNPDSWPGLAVEGSTLVSDGHTVTEEVSGGPGSSVAVGRRVSVTRTGAGTEVSVGVGVGALVGDGAGGAASLVAACTAVFVGSALSGTSVPVGVAAGAGGDAAPQARANSTRLAASSLKVGLIILNATDPLGTDHSPMDMRVRPPH